MMGRRAWLFPLIASLGGVAVFCAIHMVHFHHFAAPLYRIAPEGSPMARVGLTGEMTGYGLRALTLYTGFALAGIAIAFKTRDRLLFMLPATLFVLSPLPGMLVLQDRPALRPLLDVYDIGGGPGIWRWIFALADLVLVLLPGAFVAFRHSEQRPRADGHARVAFALCAALAILVYLRRQYVENNSFDVNMEAHVALGILFIVGATLGIRRPWFPFVHVVVAFCLSEAIFVVLDWLYPTGPRSFSIVQEFHLMWGAFLPALTAISLGALSDPLATYLRRRGQAHPVGAPQIA